MSMVVCKQCGDLLNSKHVHDFVQCGCPNETFVDGGDNYFRRGGKDMSQVIVPMTGAEARRLSAGIKEAITKKIKVSKKPNENWANDNIQFARLIAEAVAVGALNITDELMETMDLDAEQINSIMERAETVWDDIKSRT